MRTTTLHSEKRSARRKVRTAISNGTLVKAPCAVCGCEEVEAHHADYSEPLEVIWLCREHHAWTHRKRHWWHDS